MLDCWYSQKLTIYNVSSGKRHSHDRLLPFGHSQKQIAGWASGLIILVRGYMIVAAQQNRAELFKVIKIIIMDLLANIELTLNSFLAEMWQKFYTHEQRLWRLCHLLDCYLINHCIFALVGISVFPIECKLIFYQCSFTGLPCFSGWEAKVQIDSCHSGWNSKGRRPVSEVFLLEYLISMFRLNKYSLFSC